MARAVLRGFRESPRKVRVVADMIRGRPVSEALTILRMQRRKAADMLTKVLGSAIANASENDKADADQLVVTQVAIDGGPCRSVGWPDQWGARIESSKERRM